MTRHTNPTEGDHQTDEGLHQMLGVRHPGTPTQPFEPTARDLEILALPWRDALLADHRYLVEVLREGRKLTVSRADS
jgi:hypothetical protein